MPKRLSLTIAFALAALAYPAAAHAASLTGTVGPEFTISLQNESGQAVTQLDPGTHTITVRDLADEHNFHLSGPGVNMSTGVDFVGTVTWTVTLRDGRYRYVCDPHEGTMRGSFTVGNPPPPPPPPPPPAPSGSKTLNGTVGPGFTITLKDARGKNVKSLKAGTYTLKVRDRASIHNFHLSGPGVNKKTGISFTGTVTWKIKVQKGKVYRFVCDPHASSMKGSFRGT